MLISTFLALVLLPQNALPEGRLTLFAGNDTAVNFIVEDSRQRQGDQARVDVHRVFLTGYSVTDGRVVQEVVSYEVDCSGRRVRTHGGTAFGENGSRLMDVPPLYWTEVETASVDDFVARVMCDGARLPQSNTVQGAAAARAIAGRAVQTMSDVPPG